MSDVFESATRERKSIGRGRHSKWMSAIKRAARLAARVFAPCLKAVERLLDARAEVFSRQGWI